MREGTWIFGYGSLLWRPAFPFAERRAASIRGFARRFWQGSTDHRGVPGAPGRVVTLHPQPDALCYGLAYLVAPEKEPEVLATLDHRERGGYDRLEVELHFGDGASTPGLVYLAAPTNPNFLGEAPLEAIAAQIATASGPSGPNVEYVLRLANALRELTAVDDHVFALEQLLATRSAAALTFA